MIHQEEEEKADNKVEAFKSTMIQAFPSTKLYNSLYRNKYDPVDEEGVVDSPVDSPETLASLNNLLRDFGYGQANDAMLGAN